MSSVTEVERQVPTEGPEVEDREMEGLKRSATKEFRDLAEREPRLWDLLHRVARLRQDRSRPPDICYERLEAHLQDQLEKIVGPDREGPPDAVLNSPGAFDIAYREMEKLLPDCGPGCPTHSTFERKAAIFGIRTQRALGGKYPPPAGGARAVNRPEAASSVTPARPTRSPWRREAS